LVKGLILSAFFLGQGIATVMAFIYKSYPEHITGKVGGMSMGLGLIGGTVGVSAGSIALTKTHNYQASIIIVTVIAIIGFFLAIALRKPKAFARLHDDIPKNRD
jgi:MFS family permease